jgi:hypothetical protein
MELESLEMLEMEIIIISSVYHIQLSFSPRLIRLLKLLSKELLDRLIKVLFVYKYRHSFLVMNIWWDWTRRLYREQTVGWESKVRNSFQEILQETTFFYLLAYSKTFSLVFKHKQYSPDAHMNNV